MMAERGLQQATLAFYTLLVYDYFLTLPDEVYSFPMPFFSLLNATG